MDASQYKDYVLVLLFVKYVSDRYSGQPYAAITIPRGASFADMVALKGKPDIGDQINKKILGPLAQANHLADMPDFNDPAKLGTGKEMVERLTNLIAIFENPALDFSKNRAEGDDLLGDAYEYLMRHFATESGKSKGQFYTPAEVSRVIAQILGIRNVNVTANTTVYDPTCGSGSLLLKVGDEAAHGRDVRVTLYGQEKDNATAGLARMNMILHDYATAEIKQGNTLTSPLFLSGDVLKTFDYVVANPPFSDKRWSTGLDAEHDPHQRFQPYGVPPKKKGDYAYLLHILRSMKSGGKGACILPHGVLFRGGAEGAIRRNLIQRGYLIGIIGLPPNLFYGTGIPACIVALDKQGATARKGIFMIDASKGFIKDGTKNRLRAQDIHKMVDVFARQLELPRYSRMVPVAEIASPTNDYNLNIPRYIDSNEPEDLHDLDAHLSGGIPNRDIDALHAYWRVFPSLRQMLFRDHGRVGYSEACVETKQVKATILGHDEFKSYTERVGAVFDAWRKAHEPQLKRFKINDLPRRVIDSLSEDLLARFADLPLLSRYNVYQRLMDYWADVMQDDIYLIAADGWTDAAKPRGIIEDKAKKIKETPDLGIGRKKYKMDLVPPALIVARYFAKEQAAIEELRAVQETAARELEEFVEERTGEDGLLEDATNDTGKVTKGGVKDRLKAIQGEAESDEERDALMCCLGLIEAESEAGKAINEAQAALDERVLARYAKLTEAEIKTLVVEDKWFASLRAGVDGEVQRLTQQLAGRVKELEERYAQPLPELEEEVEAFSQKVEGHLKKMGLVWR